MESTTLTGLRHDCGESGSGDVHSEYRHEKQVADNIHGARDSNEYQRQFGVTQSAENTADEVIRHDEQYSAAAYHHICDRGIQRFRRRLHQLRQLPRENQHNRSNDKAQHQEEAYRSADDPAEPVLALFADVPPHENRHTHGESGRR